MPRNRGQGIIVSPFKHPFWEAFGTIGPLPLCNDEWKTIELSNQIRGKADWQRKYKDNAITEKWRKEFVEQVKGTTKYAEDIVDFVLKELLWYEKLADNKAGFQCGCNDAIVFSDTAIDPAVKEKFVKHAKALEELFETPDYHPGSNNQVVDLLHPSLFPLQYGTTPIKTEDGYVIAEYSEDISKTKPEVLQFGVSKKFQWLPAVMGLKEGKFEFTSYINNLHPVKFKLLYSDIAEIFNTVIPGLNITLSRYASEQYVRIPVPGYTDAYDQEIRDKFDKLFDSINDDEDFDEKYEALEATKPDHLVPLKPVYSGEPKTVPFDIKDSKNIKVIVKMANIELTPENPVYPGGSWHVEGTINEDIVATILYYYDTENISESRLSFRTGFEDPNYEQGDEFYCREIFGINDEDLMIHTLGSVEAKEDRVVVFPNMYQHHVDGFELADKTKSGHRKILCFFVVDPYNNLVKATDTVPPQQEEWWNEGLEELDKKVKEKILEVQKEWPQTLEETKKVRLELMEERSALRIDIDEDGMAAFARKFSLCEH